ncbi:MAG: tetratricopeptide repeat protein, partial [Candidatus Cloacimonadaceae bacterium]
SEADDALFLLAKALYYRGNSQYQAKDQFESLLRNFPNSPYAPEATLYLAKSYRQINDPDEAEYVLTDYIRQPDKEKWHPQALLLLADFAVQDKDNVKSQFWLERLLAQYPKSLYAKEASFLLGRNYFDQKDYNNSLAQFQKVLGTRGISRTMKNDARYYIALNQFYLDDCQKCLQTANRLIKDEERQDKWPDIRVLIGRALLETDKETEAIELLQEIIKSNARTLASAEAYFWLAEYYYYRQQDIQSALENYNKVKSESATTPYADEATQKYNALNLIKQKDSIILESNPRQYLDNRLEIADKFFNVLNLPDSAFVIFDKIQNVPLDIQGKIDSLTSVNDSLQIRLDSLSVMVDSSKTGLQLDVDSLTVSENVKTEADTIKTVSLDVENVAQQDSLNIDKIDKTEIPDSLKSDNEIDVMAEADSLLATDIVPDKKEDEVKSDETNQSTAVADSLNQVNSELVRIQDKLTALEEAKVLFETELIPYALFVKAAMIYNKDSESALLQPIYEFLATNYPDNKYVQATRLMLDGKPVRIIDTDLESEEILIEAALSGFNENPDSALVVLNDLAQSNYQVISNKANFRLGWFYTFEQQDTVKAKNYLDEIAKLDHSDDYYIVMSRFYNGTKYTINFGQDEVLSPEISVSDTLADSTQVDSILQVVPADSTEQKQDVIEQQDEPTDTLIKPDKETEPIDEMQPDFLPPDRLKFRKPE